MTRKGFSTAFAVAMVVAALGAVPAPVMAAPATVCTGTLSGGTYDAIDVPAGATCILQGVTVDRNVRVAEGARFGAYDSNLNLNVFARDARAVRIIDTPVLGEINLQRTTHAIVIGSSGCAVDPLADGNITLLDNDATIAICEVTVRNITLHGNTNRIGVFRNTVTNEITLTGNTDTAVRIHHNRVGGNIVASSNDYSKVIAIKKNTVEGNINCHNNVLDPTIGGNTVGGQYLGECA
jgi:hypothetical protein